MGRGTTNTQVPEFIFHSAPNIRLRHWYGACPSYLLSEAFLLMGRCLRKRGQIATTLRPRL